MSKSSTTNLHDSLSYHCLSDGLKFMNTCRVGLIMGDHAEDVI